MRNTTTADVTTAAATTRTPSTRSAVTGAARLAATACVAAALTLAGGVGCDSGGSQTYEAPKTPPAAPAAPAADKADPHAGHNHGPNDPHDHPPTAGTSTTSDPAAAKPAGDATPPMAKPPAGPAAGGPFAGAGPMAGGPPMAGMMAAAVNEADLNKASDKDEPITLGAIKATVPAGWRLENKQRMMREATFVVGDVAKNTTVIITRLGSTAGGLTENVNRWRGQVGLPPLPNVNEAEVPKVKVGGVDAMLFDMAGPADKPAKRQVQAVAPRPDGSVFYIKIIGDAGVVATQKDAFDKFLGSIQFAG